MAPANEALDKPFLRIRGVLVVSGLVIWPQGFHAKGHGSVPCGPVSLGFFLLPIPVCVCANGTMGLPQLLPSPCSAFVLFIPMGDLLQASTVSFFFLLLIKKVSVQNTFPTPLDLQVSHFLDFRFAWKSLKAKSLVFLLFSLCPTKSLCVCGNHCLFICLVYTVLQFNFSEN